MQLRKRHPAGASSLSFMEQQPGEIGDAEEFPTRSRDVSIQHKDRARGRDIGAPVSASMGTMASLAEKIQMLLVDPPPGCCKLSKDGIYLLKDDVEKLREYLENLSEAEDPPPTAKCWMEEARDLSYEMEDYIDSLLLLPPQDSTPVPVANHIKNTRSLGKRSSHVKTTKIQIIIAETLSDFRKCVQGAIERHNRFDLHSCSTLRRRFVSLGPMLPTQYDEETAHIVIDGRMNKFVNSMANDKDQQLKVVSILGSACLGKTTLAKALYKKIGKQYNCRAFIRVSKKPDMKRLFRDMLSQLLRHHPPQVCEEVDLIDSIKKYLQDKRYLIIVDDLWAASVWDIINYALPKGSNGSRIITTTQIEDVALICCCYQSEYVFEMKPLDDDHSRNLFFNMIFGSENYCPEQFKVILNEIVEMCGGSPLATVSIASLLASQPAMTIDLLTHIQQSLFSANSTSEKTTQALILSFNNLPPHLKTCLLYLSMYQEGYTFCKDDLLKQWMAEGFIDITEGHDVEKVAETYLRQLIGRRFIQPILNYNNEVLSCAVHDVVYDLIARKSAEENFIVAIDYSQNNVELSHKARRLSLLFGDARYAKTAANIIKSQVRSLRFLGSFECMPSIIDFKLLRVLNLQLSSHDGDVDLTGVSELSQLRYLKIACDCHSIVLPYHGFLETLDVMGAVDIDYRLSRDVLFPRLLRLSLPFKGMLMYWSSLHRSLQDLHLSPTTHDLGCSIQDLHFLINRLVNLKTIVMGHGSRVGNIEVVSLDEVAPPPFLQRFEWPPESGIAFHRIPKWFKELENLSILKIAVWELMNCVDILRGLHALTALSLYVQRAPVERVVFDKVGFSVLKYFKLRFTTGIAWIKFEKDAMPNLWKLKLVFYEVPRMDVPPFFTSNHTSRTEKYKHGTPLIIFEHMPGLKDISAKIGGAAADVDYIWRNGISNDLSNPSIINTQPAADYSFDSEESTKQKHQQDEIMEEEPDEYYKQQLDEAPQDEPDGSYKQQPDNTVERPVDKRSAKSLHVFTWEELMSATSNFSEENHLNGTTFSEEIHLNGTTYKGTVDGELMVNVTKWQARYLEEMHNPHVLRLLGYCYEHKILVYEHMPRGSLKYLLEADLISPLPWLTRLKIAVGAADGLAFLHETCLQKIYTHFTASRIMLALDYTAKLWDFGLAEEDEFWVSGSAGKKMDVYGFGVVLLELLAGRPALNTELFSRKRNLVEWSRPYLRHKDKLHHIMDPSLEGQYSLSAAWRTAKVVRWCINSVPEERPTMRSVVEVEALEPLLLKDGRHSRAAWWTPSSLLTRYGVVKGRSKAKQAQEKVDEPTPAASSLTLRAH